MIALRKYQEKAVHQLCEKTNELLELHGGKTIVLKAPTGSGKTVMVAEYLKDLVEYRSDGRSFAFIWMAPHQLHTQSKEKLEKYYTDSKALRCVSFEDLIDRKIGINEILFLNWESINKTDNIYIRENEHDLNLTSVIQNTRDTGRTIVLVIDESHYGAKTAISLDLVAMVSPNVSIDVSATPTLTVYDEMVNVPRENVISEGMIKKQVVINPGFKNTITQKNAEILLLTSTAAENTDDFVLRMAIEKREQLSRIFQAIGTNVNPLLLIQLPDKKKGEVDLKDVVVKTLKDNHNITLDNGKLAIYLSEDKTNLENITRNDSEVDVMIFKQAIALGWDCPRASILALFRDMQSFVFSTQTLGRILRMPELKHYPDEELNTAFVFSSLQDLSIIEDLAGDYLTIQIATRKLDYESITLRSVHSKRIRAETRLSPSFIRSFLDAAAELKLKDKININLGDANIELISDGVVEDVDKHPEHLAGAGKVVQRKLTAKDIQDLFDSFARDNLAPYFPEMRSIGKVKDSIHYFFKASFPLEFKGASTRAEIITLHKGNNHFFVDTLNRAKEIYADSVSKSEKELITNETWEVPSIRSFNHKYGEHSLGKSILQPFYESVDASDPEKQFVEFINHTLERVEWFFRNGESDATAFAIPYTNSEGEQVPFYVDWIIKFTDGTIGLFDTKLGITAETAKTRADGLAAYIKAEKTKGKKLLGGVVIPKDGSWRLNDNENYQYEPTLKDWKFLQ